MVSIISVNSLKLWLNFILCMEVNKNWPKMIFFKVFEITVNDKKNGRKSVVIGFKNNDIYHYIQLLQCTAVSSYCTKCNKCSIPEGTSCTATGEITPWSQLNISFNPLWDIFHYIHLPSCMPVCSGVTDYCVRQGHVQNIPFVAKNSSICQHGRKSYWAMKFKWFSITWNGDKFVIILVDNYIMSCLFILSVVHVSYLFVVHSSIFLYLIFVMISVSISLFHFISPPLPRKKTR